MWQADAIRAPYALVEIEVTEDLAPVLLAPEEGGAHVLLRQHGRPVGRIWLSRAEHGDRIEPAVLDPLIARAAAGSVAVRATADGLLARRKRAMPAPAPPPTPALTVAVCTRNRADLLRRCLAALVAMRETRADARAALDILVVDNAPSDDRTRATVADFADFRYVVEPVPGLDFARNRALAGTDRPWLAYVDDDAVVDRFWLERLAEGVAASPEAGGFTGPVLPLLLETEAQLRFEWDGGFGAGFLWERHGRDRWADAIYPTNAGRFGTGACMVFSSRALRAVGGFDEALDTGPPLPGGGDIDMFYRLIRSGHRLIHLPGLLVHHEHRRDMDGLRRQYHSWGQSLTTLMRKNGITDPAMRARHRVMLRWWLRHMLRRLLLASLGRGVLPPGHVLSELGGGLSGYFGEYQRSQARMAVRKREFET
jgi:GT2 family glycosyltransferase